MLEVLYYITGTYVYSLSVLFFSSMVSTCYFHTLQDPTVESQINLLLSEEEK